MTNQQPPYPPTGPPYPPGGPPFPPAGPPYPPGGPPFPPYPPGGWGPPAPPPDDPLIARDLGGWFSRWLRATRRSFWRLTGVVLLAALALAVLAGVLAGALAALPISTTTQPDLVGVLVMGVPTTLVGLAIIAVVVTAQAAMVNIIVTDAAGRRLGMREAFTLGVRRTIPMTLWWVVATLAVFVGLLLLVVPGLYLLTVVNATLTCVVVIERAGPERCFHLINRRFWATLGRLLLGWLVLQAYYYVAIIVFSVPLGGIASLPAAAGWSQQAAGIGVAVLVVPMMAAVIIPYVVANTAITVITYAELRGHEQPDATAGLLADELSR